MRMLVCLLCLAAAHAAAQTYPAKAVRIVVPLGAGSPPDVGARLVAQKMSESLGQAFVVENRQGAGGTLGGQVVAKSPPDGYSLLMGSSSSLAIGPALFSSAGYAPAKAFSAVSMVSNQPFIIVVPSGLEAATLQQFVSLVKANPGKFNVGSPASGSPPHITSELFFRSAALSMVHVPFGSIPKTAIAMLNGEAHLFIETTPIFMPHLKSGKLRALAIAAAKRSPFLPEVPTAAEAGLPDFEAGSWSGLVAPAGTPLPVIQRLNAEVLKALATREVQDGFTKQMADIQGTTPEEFGRHIAAESARWSKVIAAAGIQAN
jgi:tripartite-type tricarboxylate transporter receptor subunit TctC